MQDKVVELPIYEGHQPSRHQGIFNAQLTNLYITNKSLAPVAGLEKVDIVFSGSNIRGELNSSILNEVIVVVDDDVYSYNGNVVTEIGIAVIKGVEKVKIVENFKDQIAFLHDGIVTIYNTTTKVFAENTQIGALVQDIDYQNTYFMYQLKNSDEFKLSVSNDGLGVIQDFSGLANGRNVAIAAFGQQLWVFTHSDINVFYDTGTFPNIYARGQTLAPNYGCISKDSVAVDYGYICWLGSTDTSSPFIAISKGAEPKPISNENMDFLLDEVTNPAEALGLLYQLDGHIFYHLYFPTDGFGYVYDFLTEKFSKITYENYITNVVKYKNIYYATLFNNSNLYTFDVSITEEDGRIVDRYVITPTFTQHGTRFGMNLLDCYVETGFSEGGNCELSLSKDKGVVFRPVEVKQFPLKGSFGDFIRFRQLGSAYFVNFMLRFNVKGKFALRRVEVTL